MSTPSVPIAAPRRRQSLTIDKKPYSSSLPEKKKRRPSEVAVLCQHCGKNYKHQQCLVKHLWEHSPYWSSIPNSQPLSKHQKVQLLETASILCKLSGSPNLRECEGRSGRKDEMEEVVEEVEMDLDEESGSFEDDEDGVFGRMES